MTKNKTYHLLEMTANDWVYNSDDIPLGVKSDFVLFAGYLERFLSDRFKYKTEWDINEDVFIRIFDDSPIDKTRRKIAFRVSFHKRFIEICYEGLMISNIYISDAKAPIVTFRTIPNACTEALGIQKVFNELFRDIFKKERFKC